MKIWLRSPAVVSFLPKLPLWVAAACACWFIGAFLYVAYNSIGFPFDLEWLEGTVVDLTIRAIGGKTMYAKPSIEFVPFIYTPLYYYVAGVVSLVTGEGYVPDRLVSIVSVLGCGVVMGLWIHKEKGDWKAGVTAAGLFMATYPLSGRWFDLAHVDCMFLFLTLWGLYVFTYFRGWKYALGAAAIMTAAFFTKQPALVIVFPTMLVGMLIDWRHTLMTGCMMAVMLGVGIGLWNMGTDGWFVFYVFRLMKGDTPNHEAITQFWTVDLAAKLWILCLVSVSYVLLSLREGWRKFLKFSAVLTGFVVSSYLSRIHSGGFSNVLMPVHACLALMGGLSLAYPRRRAIVALLLTAQMFLLVYPLNKFIPQENHWDAGRNFVRELSKVDGEVFVPEMQYIEKLAGKRSYTMGMGAFDFIRVSVNSNELMGMYNEFRSELTNVVVDGRFAAIVPGFAIEMPRLKEFYHLAGHLPSREYLTGAIVFMPADLYVRNTPQDQQAPAPETPHK